MRTYSMLLSAALLAAPAAGRAAGTTAAPFLRQEPTARVTGMGGAAAALYDDAGAAYFNPAGLGFMRGNRAAFAVWNGVDEKSREAFASMIFNSGGLGGFGITYLRHSSGKEDIYDLGGNLSSVELAEDYALGAGWGFEVSSNLALGAQAKFVSSRLAETYNAKAATFDAGVLFKTDNGRFTAGGGFQNAGGELKYVSEGDPLPRLLYGGAAMRFPVGGGKLLLAADLHQPRDEARADTHAGLEYSVGLLALRLGARNVSGDGGMTAGGGIKVKWFVFDYGFQASGALDQPVHQFAFSLIFGGAD